MAGYLQHLPGNWQQRHVHRVATTPPPTNRWHLPGADSYEDSKVAVLPHPAPPSYGPKKPIKVPDDGQHLAGQHYEPYLPAAVPQPHPTYCGDPEALVQSLFHNWNRHISAQVLSVTVDGDNCLGFFPLPGCPHIPIKFRFRLNRNHRPFLTERTIDKFFIEGRIELNSANLRKYIHNHPPGGFLSLRGQTTAACQIPITIETAAITHKITNATILTKELNEIVDYLNVLGKTVIEGKVLRWNKRASCQAAHEHNNRYIKFLFDIPEQQKEWSYEELRRSFTTIRCQLSFDHKGLTRYVKEAGLGAFRGENTQKTAIAIRGKDVLLIPVNDVAS